MSIAVKDALGVTKYLATASGGGASAGDPFFMAYSVTATSLPLPTGAATAANQATEISSLNAIGGSVNSIDDKIQECNTGAIAGTVAVLNFPAGFTAVQSGTWNIATVSMVTVVSAVTAITNALPTGGNTIGGVVLPGAANLANGQVSVGTTAGGTQVVTARATRRAVTITNLGTTDVYIGVGTVSTTNGDLLLGVKGASKTICTTAAVKAIVASGSQNVSFLEEYD